MSRSETMTKRRRRSFSPEFKAEVVALCRQPGRNPASVAQELDLTETAVRRWVSLASLIGPPSLPDALVHVGPLLTG